MTQTSLPGIELRHFMGVPVHAATMAQTLELCVSAVEHRQPIVIGVVNAAKVVKMRREPILRQSVLDSDLILADGMAVVWASRLLGSAVPQRVTGIDLFIRLLDVADCRDFSVYFLGAEQDVLDAMVRQVKQRWGKLKIVGSRNGYFPDDKSEQVAEEIRAARPDLLFLGMTSPKKEIFMARWGRRLDVPVCHGVGGSFDVLAGKVKRAPDVWQRMGLEWLYRVLQEPRRMWKRYLITNTLFIGILAREMVSRKNHVAASPNTSA